MYHHDSRDYEGAPELEKLNREFIRAFENYEQRTGNTYKDRDVYPMAGTHVTLNLIRDVSMIIIRLLIEIRDNQRSTKV